MSVDTSLASLLENLKLDDPWLPPKTWESIPSQSGTLPPSRTSTSLPSSSSSSISERSLVRLAINALQGVHAALIGIERLSAASCSDPADRTFHQIPTLWNRSLSTEALAKILKSIGRVGLIVCLLHKFVNYFTKLDIKENSRGNRTENKELEENQKHLDRETEEDHCSSYSLVNQAFAIALGKILEGYTGALNTVCASVRMRRLSKSNDGPMHESGCLSNVVPTELTFLEVYLHTQELRTQIEALGNICCMHDMSHCFLDSSIEDITARTTMEFQNFYRGGNLLTYLYSQLKAADPAHRALLKFLFIRSCEPYCKFIRSWIFQAEISDPYEEFVVEYANNFPPPTHSISGNSSSASIKLTTAQERNGAAVPCFLKGFFIPLVRAGQQLQTLMRMLELCNFSASGNHTYADILPSWSGYSSGELFYASPMTFSKTNIQVMVHVRDNYYKKMQEKLEGLPKYISKQVAGTCSVPMISYGNVGRSLQRSVSIMLDEWADVPSEDERDSTLDVDDCNFDDHTTNNDWSPDLDTSKWSECSSTSGSELKTEYKLDNLPDSVIELNQHYLSTSSFSTGTPTGLSCQNLIQIDKLRDLERYSDSRQLGADAHDHVVHTENNSKISSNVMVPLVSRESNCRTNDGYVNSLSGECWPLGGLLRNPFYVDRGCMDDDILHPFDSDPKERKTDMGLFEIGMPCFSTSDSDNALLKENRGNIQLEDGSASNHFLLGDGKGNSRFHYLSMNPMLRKNVLFNTKSKSEESSREHGKFLPCFDFSSVDNPFKSCLEKLAMDSTNNLSEDYGASVLNSRSYQHARQGYGGDDVLIEETKVSCGQRNLDLKVCEAVSKVANVSGGSGWGSLLSNSNSLSVNMVADYDKNMVSVFEIPIDFVIEKCLLQEILLQYNFVSKLTIKLLEEGFALQEHLHALRRYYFMELADWADLLITSLWHHKWSAREADQKVAEIQGFLELSLQRSSCERDPYIDRLYVYMKGHCIIPVSTSAIGVDSFDFLGLGYRVDWPVSIILTPDALTIYGNIFSFLIQVKLAVLSLTDVWCLLKDFVSQNRKSVQHQQEVYRFSILIKLRHHINHFVTSLQQYVQSELSHVSWSKLLHSLKHKVKDMMDFESVHKAYLMESLHICFLSDETRAISMIIGSILQCALDFRSSLTGDLWGSGQDQARLPAKSSKINVAQVLAIQQKFDKNLKELHLCYQKSPKHIEFGLSRLWGYLNYNDYYSDVLNEINHHAFVV